MSEFNHALLSNLWYWIILLLCILIIFTYKILGAKIIGWFGELWTKQELNKLPKDKYKILNNILIKVNDNTYQIDHVIVSSYGIFSIETKQYNGYITGNKYDKNWIRHEGKNKYYYTNPIRQNYGHVKALSSLLNIYESKIFNIVCIPSKARLKIEHDDELVRVSAIINKIKSYNKKIISNTDEIVKEIIKNNITNQNIKKEHIKNIKNNIITKDTNDCPKCGGKLVERNGKYGIFKGCSNYPKCKYTRK